MEALRRLCNYMRDLYRGSIQPETILPVDILNTLEKSHLWLNWTNEHSTIASRIKFALIYVTFTACVLSIIYAITLPTQTVSEFTDHVTHMLSFSFILIKLFIFVLRHRSVNALINELQAFDRAFREQLNADGRRLRAQYYTKEIFLAVFSNIFAVIGFIFLGCQPFIVADPQLPMPARFPFNLPPKSHVFNIICTIQVVLTYTLVSLFMLWDILMATCYHQVIYCLEIEKRKLAQLGYEEMSVEAANLQLIAFIDNYNRLCGLVDGCNETFGPVLFMNIISTLTLLTFAIFYVIFAKDVPLPTVMEYVIYIFLKGTEFWMCCYIANELIDQSEAVAEAAYFSNWMDGDRTFKKNILIVMTRANDPMAVNVPKIFRLDYAIFKGVCSKIYSIVMVLRDMGDK